VANNRKKKMKLRARDKYISKATKRGVVKSDKHRGGGGGIGWSRCTISIGEPARGKLKGTKCSLGLKGGAEEVGPGDLFLIRVLESVRGKLTVRSHRERGGGGGRNLSGAGDSGSTRTEFALR